MTPASPFFHSVQLVENFVSVGGVTGIGAALRSAAGVEGVKAGQTKSSETSAIVTWGFELLTPGATMTDSQDRPLSQVNPDVWDQQTNGVPSAPIKPSREQDTGDGGREFTFERYIIGSDRLPYDFDPAVAIGYEFNVVSGPAGLRTVQLPAVGDGHYRIALWDGASWQDLGEDVLAGERFDLRTHGGPAGVGRFRVTGIETSAELDPTTLNFVTRFTFEGYGMLTMTQTSLVPEPGTWATMLLGILALGAAQVRAGFNLADSAVGRDRNADGHVRPARTHRPDHRDRHQPACAGFGDPAVVGLLLGGSLWRRAACNSKSAKRITLDIGPSLGGADVILVDDVGGGDKGLYAGHARARRLGLALLAAAALVCTRPASAQLSFDLPAPQLSLTFSLAATAGSSGPPEQFNADMIRVSNGGPDVLPLLPGQAYALQRSGELHQRYSFQGDQEIPANANGYADLYYSGQTDGRAGFGSLGVAAAMAQTGSGFQYFASQMGAVSGPGFGASTAESRSTAVDSFTVLSTLRPVGTAVSVDFSLAVQGSVSSAAVVDGSGPTAIGSLAVFRQVEVFRPGSAEPVFRETRDYWWQAGHEDAGGQVDVADVLHWLLPLQVGDSVSMRLSLLASVANQGGVPPGGDTAGEDVFDASGHVNAMNSAHVALVADALDVQLLAASGHVYTVSSVPEPSVAMLWLAGLAGLGLWQRCRARQRV